MKTRGPGLLLAAVMVSGSAASQTPLVKVDREVLLGPPSREEAPAWLAEMRRWREERLGRTHYSGTEYVRPELRWTQRSFIQPLMMVEDRYFYDPAAAKYTVDGDTMKGIPKEYCAASDDTRHILALEPELGLNGEAELPWNNMSWGYWAYNFIPTVSHYRWLEPRHLVHVCNRWARNHTDDLQHAFFNGTGFESWENVWGIWNGLAPRDAEAVRRIATIERTCAGLLTSYGYGAVLALHDESPDADLRSLLARMKRLSQKPLGAFSSEWKVLPQTQVPIRPTRPPKNPPRDMIRVPGCVFDFVVSGIMIEGGDNVGVDVQYPWEDSPRRHHRQRLTLKPFWIDRCPVTNARFKEFLQATGYRPRDDGNFLKDWQDGSSPVGWDNKPVTWVSLEDARAYARWAGKPLPHEWEWQYAAQGPDRRLFPWGNEWNTTAVPSPDNSRSPRPPTEVEAFPGGASPFGVLDMAGNVWQWTDEYLDDHTRAAIIRGGSYYFPQGSHWYFPNSSKLIEHGKLLLMAPSKDRAATLGFRCVMDAE